MKVTPQSHFNQSIVAPFDWHSYKETCTLFNFTDDDDDDGGDDDDDDDDDDDVLDAFPPRLS